MGPLIPCLGACTRCTHAPAFGMCLIAIVLIRVIIVVVKMNHAATIAMSSISIVLPAAFFILVVCVTCRCFSEDASVKTEGLLRYVVRSTRIGSSIGSRRREEQKQKVAQAWQSWTCSQKHNPCISVSAVPQGPPYSLHFLGLGGI